MAWKKKVKIKEGRFTNWCKKHGFSGPTIACIRKALAVAKKTKDKSLRREAVFALRSKKGWRKKGLTKKI